MAFSTSPLLWLDLETTGLDATKDKLLQVAALVTDAKGNLLTERSFERVVRYDNPKEIRDMAVEFVQDMHDSTGLWAELPQGDSLESIDTELLAFMKEFAPEVKQIRLAGNSVRLDLNFMEAYLPESYGHIHYRSVDVSALHFALSAWELADEFFPKAKTHSAIDDIKESLAEYRWLRDITTAHVA